MKALKYNILGKIKYDFGGFLVLLSMLFLGILLGAIISPWFFLICLLSPFLALFYQALILDDFRDTIFHLEENELHIHFSTGIVESIPYSEIISIEIAIKRDFAQLNSFPIILKTSIKKHLFLFCGLNAPHELNFFTESLQAKNPCIVIGDRKRFKQTK